MSNFPRQLEVARVLHFNLKAHFLLNGRKHKTDDPGMLIKANLAKCPFITLLYESPFSKETSMRQEAKGTIKLLQLS